MAKLKWTGPSFAGANGAIIGSQWLFDGTGMTRTPYAHAQSVTMVSNTPQADHPNRQRRHPHLRDHHPARPRHPNRNRAEPDLHPGGQLQRHGQFHLPRQQRHQQLEPGHRFHRRLGRPARGLHLGQRRFRKLSVAASWTPATAPAAAGQPFYNLNFTPAGTYTATHDLNNGFVFNQLNFAGAVTHQRHQQPSLPPATARSCRRSTRTRPAR